MTTLVQAAQNFINHCKHERKLSPKTIRFYSIDLRQFSDFVSYPIPKQISEISKIELRSYIETLSALKPKSIKRKVATLKALFNFLEFDDVIQVNPMRKIKIRIKEPKILPTVLELSEIKRMLTALYMKKKLSRVDESSYAYKEIVRNIVVIELLFATGGRVSEVSNLRTGDMDLDTGVVILKGKGNKERILQIVHSEAIASLHHYCKIWCTPVSGYSYLLINRFGGKLSEQSIRNLVKSLSKQVGINKRVTPHVFRHSFATLLLEQDVDIKYIQSLLGHSSIVTTQIYTHVSRVKQRWLLVNKHPRKDISFSEFG